jgi:methyl-accepting chemotaxis protein
MRELDELRRRGVRLLTAVGWAANATLAFLSIVRGTHDGIAAVAIGCLLNVVPTLCVIRSRYDFGARTAVALMIAIEPALLLFVMRGAAWQLDMHMYFFVALASLTILCDWKPLVLASAVVAIHHLLLSLTAPSWVFAGGGGVPRVLVHALAVVLQCAILAYITLLLRQTIAAQSEARINSERLAADATTARAAAEAAQTRAEAALETARAAELVAANERSRREGMEAETARIRLEDLRAVASDFERSIAGVATALGASARVLEGSATSLNVVAQDAGQQAVNVAAAAVQATEAAKSVAGGVGSLSRSIASIAVNVSRQANLTEHARDRSTQGGAAVQALAGSTGDVGGLANAIATIASRTDMLALNATIEAARAGNAGHGFAVVAQEVKALASQAGSATQQITSLVVGINARANDANGNFAQVSSAIAEMANATDAIHGEINEQRSAAHAIEHHAAEAAAGMADMTRRAARVSEAAGAAERLSGEVRGAASSLLQQVETLQVATDRFVSTLRADGKVVAFRQAAA